ncbi:MAG: hypothetical protein LBC18_15440 [Opitutaceae bacterium]|nr:hypothetical protein [Opitutaceae bacterium]
MKPCAAHGVFRKIRRVSGLAPQPGARPQKHLQLFSFTHRAAAAHRASVSAPAALAGPPAHAAVARDLALPASPRPTPARAGRG